MERESFLNLGVKNSLKLIQEEVLCIDNVRYILHSDKEGDLIKIDIGGRDLLYRDGIFVLYNTVNRLFYQMEYTEEGFYINDLSLNIDGIWKKK